MDLVIKNGTVVTESASIRADVGIRGGKIVAIAEKMERGGNSIDAAGKYVFPAGVEIHTHIDAVLFGMRTVDDWYVSSVGAAFGGTTTIVDYIMQGQNQALRETINEYSERARGKSIVDYSFSPIINQFTEETYREIPVLINDGITTFKTFLYYNWKVSDYDLARVLDTVGKHGGIVGIHCETAGTIDYLINRAISEGNTGPRWHATTRPVSTEVESSSRALSVAGEIGAPLFIVHISAGPVVEELAKAKARGVMAYGETMPHYLCLDNNEYLKPGYEPMKCVITPPIRSKDHQDALWAGLRSGVISTVGCDHCAFPFKDKIRLFESQGHTFNKIPHGAPGIETRIPLLFSEGVQKGKISLMKFAEVTAANPAKLTGLYPRKGTIAVGSDADITIIDPEKEVTITQATLHGKTDYTPFEGFKVKGYPVTTLCRGTVLVENGKLLAQSGHGEFLKREKFIPF